MRTLKLGSIVLLVVASATLSGCESRTDRVDSGGVLLSVSDFDGLPAQVSVNPTVQAGGLVQVEEIDIQNIAKDPNGITSNLMNVEIESYEVVYSRADTGTLLPPPFTHFIFGVAPVNGDITFENLPVMNLNQFESPPLADLLLLNGAFDRETGDDKITLNLSMRFFGRTLSGDPVTSAPAAFTVVFVP